MDPYFIVRILFVHTALECGGLEKNLLILTTLLKELGHGVCVAAAPGPMLPEFRAKGIQFEELSFRRSSFRGKNFVDYVGSTRRLLAILTTGAWEMVDAQSRYVLPAAWIASRRSGQPLVFTAHNYFDRYLFLGVPADYVVAVSQAVSRNLIENARVKPHRIGVIPYGLVLREAKRDQLPASFYRSGKIVITAARLVPEKGIDTLIRAATLVVEAMSDVTFVVAGEGPMKTTWEKLALSCGLDKRIQFIGKQENMDPWYSSAHIYVLPSKSREGLPISILEAMEAHLPVVATDVGGIREAVEDTVTGFVVPVDDHVQLAEKIVRLLSDEQLRIWMGRHGRQKLEKEFTAQQMVQQRISTYKSLLRDTKKK